jgi:uncharacterized membrane protein YuzA (DUF378 family)
LLKNPNYDLDESPVILLTKISPKKKGGVSMNTQTKKWVHIIAFVLVIVGGINWGLFGLIDLDLVDAVFGGWAPVLANIIYVIIGLAAIYLLFVHKNECKICDSK